MPYEGLGARHEAIATKVCQHGQIVVEDNIVGSVFKALQLTPFVDPVATDGEGRLLSQQVAVGESFEIQIGGVHEMPLIGELEGLEVGDRVYIRASDNHLFGAPTTGGTNEVQTLTEEGVTAGHFTLEFEGDVTANIAFNATAKEVLEALEGLADIEEGDITVTGAAAGPYTVTFKGRYQSTNVPALVANNTGLIGTSPKVKVATSSEGAAGAGNFPVGVISEVDVSREPAVARINANSWQSFLQAGSVT
ncbi:MAG TPA: hypothetical protein VGG08_05450 [Solirubrobacteraceae bacterium]|jgi:hypothetical protein